MALTALMFVVLVISYALMFWLVQFTENVIDPPKPADHADIAKAGETNAA